MGYRVEGSVGEFELPLGAKNGVIKLRIVPSAEYAHESSEQGKVVRRILMVGSGGNAKLVDLDSEFFVNVADCQSFASLLLGAKTSKMKVRVECNEKRNVESIKTL